MIQLRVRTEYTFRHAYGPIDRVAERLSEIGCTAAAIVDDSGTWGHVDWEKALTKKGITPIYGAEFTVPTEDGHTAHYWALAKDLPSFYRFSSSPPQKMADLLHRNGVIVFAGSGLTDPLTFDYIDINPRSRRQTKQALQLHRITKRPLVITSDNDYPGLEDRNKFLAWDDSLKMTPQHILDAQELRAAFPELTLEMFNVAMKNAAKIAKACGHQKLAQAPIIRVEGDLDALVKTGKAYRLQRGHIAKWTKVYQARLEREMKLIKEKEFESYFIVVSDLIAWAKQHMLVGPGRGSSAGSLVCFLLGITEIDPLVHNLIFERFIDINRADLPDIDIDFNDKKREIVFDYLAQKYGSENTARIGSINRLKPRSVISHVAKKMGIPPGAHFGVLNVLIEHSSGDSRYGHALEDTLETTQPGKDFIEKYPEAAIMTELENHASHTGVHAAGVIVSNVPVVEFCTVRDGIAQIDKKGAEYLNLLKIDALGLRTLGVIEDAACVTPQELYDLKLNDPAVFDIFNKHKFSGVFQFEGAAQRRVSRQIPITEFQQIDHITALSRPGPLGGGAANHYIMRHLGKEQTVHRHPSMAEYLGDTYGVVLYQEQVMRIVRELGDFSWEDTSVIRKAMSGRKGAEFFDQRGEAFTTGAAKKGIDEETAKQIWSEIVNFGAWGMNKSHTVSYSVISYWCAWMKAYHEVEYAAASLRNAKDEEQAIEMLRELREEGVPFVPFDAELSEVNWTAKGGKLIGGYNALVGIGPVKAAYYVQKRDTTGLSEADLKQLAKHQPKIVDLSPAHTMWGDIYRNPSNYNIEGRVKQFNELEDFENAVVICQLIKLDRRDENEEVRANKRGYKKSGETLFVDAFVVDDSIGKPVLLRIKPYMWKSIGVKMADRAVPKKDWFLVRGKWLKQFSMMTVTKIKCLTNKEMFE